MTMNILGIDFEEWYHPELIKNHVKIDQRIPKVFKGIDTILDLLNKHNVSATFFVVGEILQHSPELIDKIISNNHEIAFHTMHHDRIDSPNFLKADKIFIRPNTDTALMLSLAYLLIINNTYDKFFIEKYTVGFEEFKK